MTASLNPQQEILIVGAGPVGLTIAACLAQYGTPCRIIDKANNKRIGAVECIKTKAS